MTAVTQLDGESVDRVLSQASLEMSQTSLIQNIIVPLIHQIGQQWEAGRLKIAHEHVASASIRTFLGNFMRQHSPAGYAPSIVVTTPAGQIHELGAILAAAEANNHGWKVCYLGPSLPAEEIAAAAIQNDSQAVALSIVYPTDDPRLGEELARLRKLLPPGIALLVGGRASPAYQSALARAGAIECRNIADFGAQLKALRALKNA
jgi:methanogenic corrinoid protein MtbC1